MKASIMQCRYLLSLAEPIIAGLDDTHLALEPKPGTKTAGWIIGHLTVTADFARRLCGGVPICPAAWRDAFYPGTEPSHDHASYPPMAELREAFWKVHNDLLLLAETNPASLAADNPFAPARAAFPSAGDFVEYLLSAHLGYHLGQIVGWRAAAGMGRLRRPDSLAA